MTPGTFWRISSSLWVTFKSLPRLLCIPKTAMDLYFLKAYVPSETPRRFKLHLCNHTTTQTKNSFIENHLNHPKSSSKCFTSLLTVIHNKSDLSSAFNNFKRQISVASGWLSEPALPAIFSIHIWNIWKVTETSAQSRYSLWPQVCSCCWALLLLWKQLKSGL